ncbi:zinc finger protein 260-like [Hippocampus comes]|uniref:zinc finger protein 260-like n=1 Tax=Hippocampus comes TaxID=109280 RepID=UPI00094E8AA6|nr:PREDICTED: zinc finger protein 260-like [Hippocampus comes]
MEGLRPPPILSLHSSNLAKTWKTWKEQFTLYVELTMPNAEEDTKCKLFHLLIGEEGRQLLSTWWSDDVSAGNTVRDVMRKFDELWNPKLNETVARYAFFTRDQATGENVDKYVTELRVLASTCNFEQLKDSLIKDRIVCGTNDNGLRERLLREENLTLEKCLKICRASELSRENWKTLQGQTLNEVYSVKEEKKSKDLGPERQVTQFATIKEEEELEPLHIKEEEREDDIDDVPFIGVTAKSDKDVSEEDLHPESPHVQEEEDYRVGKMPPTFAPLTVEQDEEECQNEQSRGAHPPSCSSSQPASTEVGAGHRGRSRADGLSPPLPHDGDITSHAHSTDDDEDDEGSHGDQICHTDNKCWKCSQCDKTFDAQCNLKVHVTMHTGETPLTSAACSQRLTQTATLAKHKKTHVGEKYFACSVCHQKFRKHCNLKAHLRTHTGEKPFVCSVCDKRFTERGHLKKHSRTHTGEKPFACSVCGHRFSDRRNVRNHARTHTGEKPFACFLCGKTFAQKAHLKRHARTHTGEKPFACSVCGQRFSDRGGVRIHARTHTGEKPFACFLCGKAFTQKTHLRQHARTHTGEKPFSCSVCDRRFTNKYRVTKHNCAGENSSAR